MAVFLYDGNNAAYGTNLQNVLRRTFGSWVRFQDLEDGQVLATLDADGIPLEPKLFGLFPLFKIDPENRRARAAAVASEALVKWQWTAHAETFGEVIAAMDTDYDLLLYIGPGGFSAAKFRPHPHPFMRGKGMLIATGPGLPAGGVVRVGPGNDLHSSLYGRKGRTFVKDARTALIQTGIEMTVDAAVSATFARVLRATGLKINIGGEGERAAQKFVDVATSNPFVKGLHVQRTLSAQLADGSVARVYMRNIAPTTGNGIAKEIARVAKPGARIEIITTPEGVTAAKTAFTQALPRHGVRIVRQGRYTPSEAELFDIVQRSMPPGTSSTALQEVLPAYRNMDVAVLELALHDGTTMKLLILAFGVRAATTLPREAAPGW